MRSNTAGASPRSTVLLLQLTKTLRWTIKKMPDMGPATLRGSISLGVGERKPDGSPPVLVKFTMQGAKSCCASSRPRLRPCRLSPMDQLQSTLTDFSPLPFSQQERRPLVSRCSAWMCTTWYVLEGRRRRWQAAGFAGSRQRYTQLTMFSLSSTLQAYKPFKGVKYIMEGGDYEVRNDLRGRFPFAFASISTRPFHSPPRQPRFSAPAVRRRFAPRAFLKGGRGETPPKLDKAEPGQQAVACALALACGV